jgi:hypothetical protein
MVTDVSEEHNASFFRIEINSEDSSSMLLRNACNHFILKHSVISPQNRKTQDKRL